MRNDGNVQKSQDLMAEDAACEQTCENAPVSPSDDMPAASADRGKDGKFVAGNRAAFKTGAFAERYRLPPAVAEAVRDLDGFAAQVTADQGGRGELTAVRAGYIRRLVSVEAVCELLFADIRARGIFTRRGRVRSTLPAFLQAVGSWDLLARRLGLDRRQAHVKIPSPHEWLDE